MSITVTFPIYIDENSLDYSKIKELYDLGKINDARDKVKDIAYEDLSLGNCEPIITDAVDMPDLVE